MENKIVIFDWGGVIMNKYPEINNDREAIIRTIKSFNFGLNDDEAWSIYLETLLDENGIYISRQNDEQSKEKWVDRIKQLGNFKMTTEEFENRFSEEHLKVGYHKEVVEYAHSLKKKCKIGLFSDLIYACYPALDKQVDLSKFDYVWLSYQTHLRKNTEEAFALVEEELKMMPRDIMFIDDTSKNIENAKKRGWNTCQAIGSEFEMIKRYVDNFLSRDKSEEFER